MVWIRIRVGTMHWSILNFHTSRSMILNCSRQNYLGWILFSLLTCRWCLSEDIKMVSGLIHLLQSICAALQLFSSSIAQDPLSNWLKLRSLSLASGYAPQLLLSQLVWLICLWTKILCLDQFHLLSRPMANEHSWYRSDFLFLPLPNWLRQSHLSRLLRSMREASLSCGLVAIGNGV